jgi:hypothetical protein
MDKKLTFGHFWIFLHGGMSRWAAEISGFRLTRRAADYLKIENFNPKIFIFSKTRNFKFKKIIKSLK